MTRTFQQEVFEILYPAISDEGYDLEQVHKYETAIVLWTNFAYLLGAINYDPSTPQGIAELETEFEEHRIFINVIKGLFAPDHKIWKHIRIIDNKETK